MAAYHEAHGLRLDRRGKVLLPTREEDSGQLDLLYARAKQNGVQVERLDERALREIEPEARSASGEALLVPTTAVGSPAQVMRVLFDEVQGLGVTFRCGAHLTRINLSRREMLLASGETMVYGHAVNAAGLHADAVAHRFGAGQRYTMLPFKGIYWKLNPAAGIAFRHLIYPVPDLRVPFLGVHTTTTTDGSTYLGPTAVPAFGRENYTGFAGVTPREFVRIASLLARQFVSGRDGFRRLAWQEGRRFFKARFVDAARAIVPRLRAEHLIPTDKVGIRAQLLDRKTGHLVNDFLVERGTHSTHVLNAISPAWTSAFPFARYVCDNFIEGMN